MVCQLEFYIVGFQTTTYGAAARVAKVPYQDGEEAMHLLEMGNEEGGPLDTDLCRHILVQVGVPDGRDIGQKKDFGNEASVQGGLGVEAPGNASGLGIGLCVPESLDGRKDGGKDVLNVA